MKACILVLGLPRSGTSCVAGVLHHLGVSMGDRFADIDPVWNQKGSFVCAEFAELIDQARTGDLHNEYPLPLPTYVLASIRLWAESKEGVWGVKHHLLPYALPAFTDLDFKVIRTSRPFQQSIQSWNARVTPQERIGSEAFLSGLDLLINAQSPIREEMTVSFDALMEDSESEVRRIASFVGKEVTREAVEFIDPTLRRYY